MHKILVSACLLGSPVRYDGQAKTLKSDVLTRWTDKGRVISVCPEVMGGLPTPRPPAEIFKDSQIIDNTGADVTEAYMQGAKQVLEIAKANDCKFALLTDGSPSCGSGFIYDGSFTVQTVEGMGVVTALLRQNGIQVFAQTQIEDLANLMRA